MTADHVEAPESVETSEMSRPLYYSVQDAMRQAKQSQSTILRAIGAGTLPAGKFATGTTGAYVILPADLTAYVAKVEAYRAGYVAKQREQ